ncbi:hypothetical protein V1514DRAFT_298586, partial [Lipomyces japonicus]|uniref:uncharacterized protein n=1 Tax=Lipomyces japonicus TaxID=56871 RepID=UPI0034CFDEE1
MSNKLKISNVQEIGTGDKSEVLKELTIIERYEKGYAQLNELFNCNICSSLMLEPCVISCGHSFCYQCLDIWFHQNLTCPTCRTDVLVCPALSFQAKHAANVLLQFHDDKEEIMERHQEETKLISGHLRTCSKLFPDHEFEQRKQELTYVDSDDGVARCGRCHWEMEGRRCIHCYPADSDSNGEDEDEDDGSENSPIYPWSGLLPTRLDLSDYDDEDEEDEEDENGDDYDDEESNSNDDDDDDLGSFICDSDEDEHDIIISRHWHQSDDRVVMSNTDDLSDDDDDEEDEEEEEREEEDGAVEIVTIEDDPEDEHEQHRVGESSSRLFLSHSAGEDDEDDDDDDEVSASHIEFSSEEFSLDSDAEYKRGFVYDSDLQEVDSDEAGRHGYDQSYFVEKKLRHERREKIREARRASRKKKKQQKRKRQQYEEEEEEE